MNKILVIRTYNKGDKLRRATLTYVEEIPFAEMKRITKWLSNEDGSIFGAKKVLTVNVVPKD